MPTTLRIELNKLGYDWEHGSMVTQPGRGWESPGITRQVKQNDPMLDQVHANGASLDLPRFLASDKKAVYVVYRTDDSSGLKKILRAADYVGTNETIPYPE